MEIKENLCADLCSYLCWVTCAQLRWNGNLRSQLYWSNHRGWMSQLVPHLRNCSRAVTGCCVCVWFCTEAITAEVSCAKSRNSFIGVTATGGYRFPDARRLLKTQDDRMEPATFDAWEHGLKECSIPEHRLGAGVIVGVRKNKERNIASAHLRGNFIRTCSQSPAFTYTI